MPREQINTPHVELWTPVTGGKNVATGWDISEVSPVATGDDPPDSHVEVTPTLHVHWTAATREGAEGTPDEGFAQIELSVHVETLRRMLSEADVSAGFGPEHAPTQLGFFTRSLTRAETQKLIRVSRRARDQVFGGDE